MLSKPASSNVLNAVERCFASSDYSDLTISCGASTWKVHRMIVCSQSPVLHAASEGYFMEATGKVIKLDGDDPMTVNLMLNYLYTGGYDYSVSEQPESLEQSDSLEQRKILPLTLHIKMYILADKYQIPALMRLAENKYQNALCSSLSIEEYFQSIPEVYLLPSSAGQLRAIAVQYARENLKKSIKKEDAKESLRQLIIDVPEYGFEVLEVFINHSLRGTCHNCGGKHDAEVLQARCRKCGKGGLSVTSFD